MQQNLAWKNLGSSQTVRGHGVIVVKILAKMLSTCKKIIKFMFFFFGAGNNRIVDVEAWTETSCFPWRQKFNEKEAFDLGKF